MRLWRPATSLGRLDREALVLDAERAVRSGDTGIDEVHRRAADDRRDESVRGHVVDGLWRVHLLKHALAQHRDAVGHAHRLDLVVRDIDERPAEFVLEPLQLRSHLEAEERVERRQRLVE